MREMDRRTFLKRAGLVAAGSAAVGLGAGLVGPDLLKRLRRPWDEGAFPPPGRPRVLVARIDSYRDDLEGIVESGLREVGVEVAGRSVLLKPNLVEHDPDTAINTDPRLVAATVLAMRRLGAASVAVADGPANRRDTASMLEASGFADVLGEVGAPFVDLNIAPARRVVSPAHFTDLGALWLPEPVLDADVVISMPKMKTHHWAGVTLSLKNTFGCVPGRIYGWPKNVLHWAGITEAIMDVAAAVRPSVQIVDGIVGMEGDGPLNGTPLDAGLLLFGTDPVATDSTAALSMRLDPDAIEHIHEAGRFLGQADLERVHQVGEDPEAHATPFAVIPGFEHLRIGSTATDGGGHDGLT